MGGYLEFRPQARVEGLASETVDDGLVVYDTTSCVAHALTAEAASVWRCCDGTRSSTDIARELGTEADRVDSAIFELERCGLLEAPVQAPPRFSRREAGAKLGKAAVLGPLIYSLAIPTPAAAASPTTCRAGAKPGATCLRDGTALAPSGPSVHGTFGHSALCPIIDGNEFIQNCYGANVGNAVFCNRPGGCQAVNQGCGSATQPCCAGAACCSVPVGGGFACSQ